MIGRNSISFGGVLLPKLTSPLSFFIPRSLDTNTDRKQSEYWFKVSAGKNLNSSATKVLRLAPLQVTLVRVLKRLPIYNLEKSLTTK